MSNSSNFADNICFDVYDTLEKFYRSLNIELNKRNSSGYTCGQGRMLRYLHENGESTQSQLSVALGITASSVSEISEKLLSAGFISKASDSQDKRRSYLSITQSGILQLSQLKDDFFDFINSSFSSLNADELSELHRLLLKLLSFDNNPKRDAYPLQSPNIRRGTRL